MVSKALKILQFSMESEMLQESQKLPRAIVLEVLDFLAYCKLIKNNKNKNKTKKQSTRSIQVGLAY